MVVPFHLLYTLVRVYSHVRYIRSNVAGYDEILIVISEVMAAIIIEIAKGTITKLLVISLEFERSITSI